MARPSSTAATIVAKLSSARTISAAVFATAVPDPMAIPMLARLRAGASFTPSPLYQAQLVRRLRPCEEAARRGRGQLRIVLKSKEVPPGDSSSPIGPSAAAFLVVRTAFLVGIFSGRCRHTRQCGAVLIAPWHESDLSTKSFCGQLVVPRHDNDPNACFRALRNGRCHLRSRRVV
eukprot:scaffold16864_cov27-Tisochrysis_lutea.AAC.5